MKEPVIIHAVPRRELSDSPDLPRFQRAWDSWNWLYKVGGVVPCHQWKFKRDARNIGDQRDLPFLKDVLAAGLERATNPFDVVLFTNDDVLLHPMFKDEANRFLSFHQAGSARRVDVDTRDGKIILPPLYSPPISFVELGWPHLGRDAFVFNAGWLKHNWNLIPDFILGAWGWDICMAALIRFLRGYRNEKFQSFYDSYHDCELPDGLIIHEAHTSKWMEGSGWEVRPANAHNRRLFEEWRKRYWPSLTVEAVDKQEWSKRALLRYPRYLNWKGQTLETIAQSP